MIVFRNWVRHPKGEPDLSVPMIVCDACDEQITRSGLVLWLGGDDDPIWHVHKGQCDREIESRTDRRMKSRELAEWLDQLRRNTMDEDPFPEDELDRP